MHYITRLIDNFCSSFHNAIKRFGKFTLALDDLFRHHRDMICAEAGTMAGFFCRHLDHYHPYWWHHYLTYNKMPFNELKAGWTLYHVVQIVRRNMIVDAIRHVNVLQRGRELFPCDYDGYHDLAVQQHNYFCHPRRIKRFKKYAIEQGFQIYGLPEMNYINLQVLRTLDEFIDTRFSDLWAAQDE